MRIPQPLAIFRVSTRRTCLGLSQLFSIVVFAYLFTISDCAFADTGFRRGYVILNSNDTITGFVESQDGFKSFRSCRFKESEYGKVTEYSPADAIGYGIFRDKVFVAMDIENGTDERKDFFRAIIGGMVSLYELEYSFYLMKDGTLHILKNEEKESIVQGTRTWKHTNQHIATANMLMGDRHELRDRLARLQLTEPYLSKLVEDYNKLSGVKVIVYKDLDTFSSSETNISKNELQDGLNHLESLYSQSKLSTVQNGVSVRYSPTESLDGFSFLGGHVFSVTRHSDYAPINHGFTGAWNYLSLSQSNLFGNYSSSGGRFSPYVNLGLYGNQRTNLTPTDVTAKPWIVDPFTRNPFLASQEQIGYWSGIGVSKPFSSLSTYFELRYEQTSGAPMNYMGQFPGMPGNSTNVQFVIGFRRR